VEGGRKGDGTNYRGRRGLVKRKPGGGEARCPRRETAGDPLTDWRIGGEQQREIESGEGRAVSVLSTALGSEGTS